jgi:hypothetical protein
MIPGNPACKIFPPEFFKKFLGPENIFPDSEKIARAGLKKT